MKITIKEFVLKMAEEDKEVGICRSKDGFLCEFYIYVTNNLTEEAEDYIYNLYLENVK